MNLDINVEVPLPESGHVERWASWEGRLNYNQKIITKKRYSTLSVDEENLS